MGVRAIDEARSVARCRFGVNGAQKQHVARKHCGHNKVVVASARTLRSNICHEVTGSAKCSRDSVRRKRHSICKLPVACAILNADQEATVDMLKTRHCNIFTLEAQDTAHRATTRCKRVLAGPLASNYIAMKQAQVANERKSRVAMTTRRHGLANLMLGKTRSIRRPKICV